MVERFPESPWEREWREFEENHLERPRQRDDILTPQVFTPRTLPDKVLNHYKNLHGAPGVEGLTGRWRGKMYVKGIPRLSL